MIEEWVHFWPQHGNLTFEYNLLITTNTKKYDFK